MAERLSAHKSNTETASELGSLTRLGVDEGEGATEGLLDLSLADLLLDLDVLLELLVLLGCEYGEAPMADVIGGGAERGTKVGDRQRGLEGGRRRRQQGQGVPSLRRKAGSCLRRWSHTAA